MRNKTFKILLATATLSMSAGFAVAGDLEYVIDETVNYTEDCKEGWYMLEQREPIFSRGMPPYKATAHIQFQAKGITDMQTRIVNYPTDFGAKTVQQLHRVQYVRKMNQDGTFESGDAELGYIVATKHVALEGNTRRTCVYAEHSEIGGYTMHESPVSGSYQRPKIHIRRFIGEVESGRNAWADFKVGTDSELDLSMKIDISRTH